MNKNDLRYIKTDKLIVDTFLDCIDSVGFEKTSVSLICEKASISRTTFYDHYEDKYILYNSLFAYIESELINSMNEGIQSASKNQYHDPAILWFLDCVEKNKKIVKAIIKTSYYDFTLFLDKISSQLLLAQVYDQYASISDQFDLKLKMSFMVRGTLGFIDTWLTDGQQYSKEDIYRIMEKMISFTNDDLIFSVKESLSKLK